MTTRRHLEPEQIGVRGQSGGANSCLDFSLRLPFHCIRDPSSPRMQASKLTRIAVHRDTLQKMQLQSYCGVNRVNITSHETLQKVNP